MNTKTQETDSSQDHEQNKEHEHVHGPHCNHGHSSHDPIVRQQPKVGRNDLCICGSQKKFKKCCGK